MFAFKLRISHESVLVPHAQLCVWVYVCVSVCLFLWWYLQENLISFPAYAAQTCRLFCSHVSPHSVCQLKIRFLSARFGLSGKQIHSKLAHTRTVQHTHAQAHRLALRYISGWMRDTFYRNLSFCGILNLLASLLPCCPPRLYCIQLMRLLYEPSFCAHTRIAVYVCRGNPGHPTSCRCVRRHLPSPCIVRQELWFLLKAKMSPGCLRGA